MNNFYIIPFLGTSVWVNYLPINDQSLFSANSFSAEKQLDNNSSNFQVKEQVSLFQQNSITQRHQSSSSICLRLNQIENRNLRTNQIQSKKILTKILPDDDYIPGNKVQDGKKKQIQNEQRNIIPNIVHQIISFIQKSKRSKMLIGKILKQNKFVHKKQWTLKRFEQYQKMVKQHVNNYVNLKTLEWFMRPLEIDNDIYEVEERMFYCKICRILIKYFLDFELRNLILTSSKIKHSNKILHLKGQRIIYQKLQEFSF